VPDIEGYKKEGDKYRVTFKTPDIVPLLYVLLRAALSVSSCLSLLIANALPPFLPFLVPFAHPAHSRYHQISKFADLPSTRKAAVLGYEGKTIQNAPLLAEMVKLKEQAAKMLGYESHAEWVLEVRLVFPASFNGRLLRGG